MTVTSHIPRGFTAVLLGALLFCACEDKKSATARTDGGVSDKPAIDPNIAKAVAAASARSGPGGASKAGQPGGPPPTGVFEPGEADKAMPKSSPPKITIGSEGSEPRIALGARQPPPGYKRDLTVQLLIRSGRQGMPPIDFALGLQTAPKAKPAAAPGAAPAPAPAAVPGPAEPVTVVATVKGTRIAPSQAAGLPKEFETELTKLKGSKIEFRMAPNGAGDGFRYELAKAADPGLENAIRSLAEALATVTLPYPDKPVGAGAFWMATSRETAIGVEVVAYRIVKVAQISDGKLKLSVNTKRYAVDKKFDLPELPKETTFSLDQFDSQGESEYQVTADAPFPVEGQVTLALNATLVPANQPDQRAAVQSQTRAAFALATK
jgi:hypothetical protein